MIDAGNKQFRLLSIVDLERAILVQSSAFNNDPFWQYLIPNPEKRTKMLPQFFSVFLKVNIHNGTAYGISTPIEGVAVWSAPNQKSIDLSGFIGSDLVKLSLNGFLFPFLKAFKIFIRFENMQKKHAPNPHYYLNTIAVLPESQGKGLASKLIRPFLEKADEESVAAYTETMTLANVGLYEHFGFHCVEQYHVPKTELNIWALYRPTKLRR